MGPEFRFGGKCGVENGAIDLVTFQVSRDIQQAQRGVGPHNFLFFGVFLDEVTVGQQDIHPGKIDKNSMWESKELGFGRMGGVLVGL